MTKPLCKPRSTVVNELCKIVQGNVLPSSSISVPAASIFAWKATLYESFQVPDGVETFRARGRNSTTTWSNKDDSPCAIQREFPAAPQWNFRDPQWHGLASVQSRDTCIFHLQTYLPIPGQCKQNQASINCWHGLSKLDPLIGIKHAWIMCVTYKQTSAALQLAKANCSNSSCEESPSSSIASTFEAAFSDADVDCGRLGYFWKEAKCQHDKLVSVLVGSSLSVPRPPKKSHPPKKKQLWRQPGSLPRLGFDLTPSLLPDLASDMMSHVSGLNVLNLHEKRQSHITLSSRQSHGFTKHHMPNVHCQPRAHQHPTRLDEEGEGAKQSIPSKRATPKSQAVIGNISRL